jgi:uncharacterized cofD-like protein
MKRKKIVTIGGGTGSYMLLSGLKKYPVDLTAIVSMADDGGSTGRLRDELGVLPPGDVRQCLVALSESSKQLRELMQYRFEKGDLKGHNFGNIFVSALEKTYGSLSRGVEEAGKILNVCGSVVPITEGDMRLVTTLENGEKLYGEDALDDNKMLREKGIQLKKIELKKQVSIHPKALEAMRQADTIVLGPSDHFSNLIPSLLVRGCVKALRETKAKIYYIGNLTNKRGLTSGWNLDDYVNSLESHLGKGRIDAVIWNTGKIKYDLRKKYEQKEGKGSIVECNASEGKRGYTLVKARVLASTQVKKQKGDAIAHTRSFIRHDSDKLAKAIMLFSEMEEQKVIEDVE